MTGTAEAFNAAACASPQDALRLARGALGHAGALGISSNYLRLAWPRAAHQRGTPPQPASHQLCLAPASPDTWRPCNGPNATWSALALAASSGDPAAAYFATAISGLHENSTPNPPARGLLHHAGQLIPLYDAETAGAAISEARDSAL